jgi:hypothetical protein
MRRARGAAQAHRSPALPARGCRRRPRRRPRHRSTCMTHSRVNKAWELYQGVSNMWNDQVFSSVR